MLYARKTYIDQLVLKKDNGRVKIITGSRRCGKSFLLFTLYRQYLRDHGVGEDQIIDMALDEIDNARYRNPFEFTRAVKGRMTDSNKRYYVLTDEIQFLAGVPNPYVEDPDERLTFVDVLLGLMKCPNVDIYVTGSDAKMLSSEVLSQFRDRGDEIRVGPLSFAEVYENYQGDKRGVWRDYYTYGGMPFVWTMESREERCRYLRNLIRRTYISDVFERHLVKNDEEVLEILLNVLASGAGTLSNPKRLSDILKKERHIRVAPHTVDTYISFFLEAFLVQKARRYDVTSRKYLKTPCKYYFSDVGIRNAGIGFHHLEETALMENVLYNELVRCGFDVDVGVVLQHSKDGGGKGIRRQLEVDFVANRGADRWYVQSALGINDPEMRRREIAALVRIHDSFRKIVVVRDFIQPWRDEYGIWYVGIEDFLMGSWCR